MARKIVRLMPSASRASARLIIGRTRMSIFQARYTTAYHKADLGRHQPLHSDNGRSWPPLPNRLMERRVHSGSFDALSAANLTNTRDIPPCVDAQEGLISIVQGAQKKRPLIESKD